MYFLSFWFDLSKQFFEENAAPVLLNIENQFEINPYPKSKAKHIMAYTLGCPLPSNSHHQDYYIF